MDLFKNRHTWAGVALSAGAAGCLAYVLNKVASAPIPKENIEKRAQLVAQRMLRSLKEDYTFDQLVSGLEVEEIRGDGFVRSTIIVAGPMVSKEQRLHEGGLMCLIDDLTSLAVWVRAAWPGVSVEMHGTLLEPIQAGEKLVAEARVDRVGSTLAFSSFELRRAGEGGKTVAVGGQTKHIGLPFLQRFLQGLGCRYLPFGAWLADRGSAKSRQALDAAVKAGKLPPLKKIQEPSLEPALGLTLLGDENAGDQKSASVSYSFISQLHLLNGYWGGHGAASAALFAEATKRYTKDCDGQSSDMHISDLRCSYMTPVPPFRGLGIVVKPLPASDSCRHFVTELCNDKGQVFVRGSVTAMMRTPLLA